MNVSSFGGKRWLFLAFVCMELFCVCVSNAEQYYDPKYRRYVFVGDEPAKIRNIRNSLRENPSPQQQVQKDVNSESAVRAYRKFDPNRYHNTEEIDYL
jgi:hypothetical protein